MQDPTPTTRLRVAAISFLNPAPLMWDFEHPPEDKDLASRFSLRYTPPSQCAADLLSGHADLGLIPIASLTPDLAIVPGCTIASLDRVRSIQLVLKHPHTLSSLRTIAADTSSRSSLAYAQVLFRHFLHTSPTFHPHPADLPAMLRHHDAALLIGDPALLALESRDAIEAHTGPLTWHDLAHEWHSRTHLPWVAAVWAVRPASLGSRSVTPAQLIRLLQASRDHGLAHIEDLVHEWTPRLPLPPSTLRTYLTENIHYRLDESCLRAISTFRDLASRVDALPPLPSLNLLEP